MGKLPPLQNISKNFTIPDNVLIQIAQDYGTPIYVYDAGCINEQWKKLNQLIPSGSRLFYSVKANPNIKILEYIQKMGGSFEVASLGELKAVLSIGALPTEIIFVGPGKTDKALMVAIESGIHCVVAESAHEIDRINILASKGNKKVSVALRINFNRGKGAISMGGVTQFGMEPEIAIRVLANSASYKQINFMGLHTYMGTGVLEPSAILNQTKSFLDQADSIETKSGTKLYFLDAGGGWGIPYFDSDHEPDWEQIQPRLESLVKEYRNAHEHTTEIAFESGRFIIGPAGVFLTRVLDVKKSWGKWFVILDGGINVFGGDDQYKGFRSLPIRMISRETNQLDELTLCGPLCTSADRLAVDTILPVPEVGDVYAFYQAGAYRYTASPGFFLSHGFPTEVLFLDDASKVIRSAITVDAFLK